MKRYLTNVNFLKIRKSVFVRNLYQGNVSLSSSKFLITLIFLIATAINVTAQTTAGLLADKLIFSSSSAGSVTYSPVSVAATTWQTGTTLNTNAVTAVTITSLTNGGGFSFNFDGTAYSAVNISNNGFITFGATAPTATTYNPISAATSYSGAVAGYGYDLVASTYTGASPVILYEVTGTAPNREFVIQFQDLARTGFTGSAADKMNFQIRLVETSNVIKIVYGTWASSATTTTASNFGQVGLRGESIADFHTRIVAPATATNHTTWANSGGSGDIGSTPVQTAAINTAGINCMQFINTCFPSATSTLTYTWTPIPSTFFQSIPYTQNFDSWVNVQALKDVPASTGVVVWPSSGNLSWRTITEPILNSSWNSNTGNFAAPTTKAGAGSATFNQYGAPDGTKGYMDFFMNFSTAGTKGVDFYIRNPGTATTNDILQVYLSTDGGISFTQIGTNITAPTPTTATAWSAKQTLTLTTSTSSACILRFQGVSDYGSSAENLAIDELAVYILPACSTPTAQPLALNLTNVTATTLNGAFTAATPAPSGYIVLRSTTNSAPALVNGTTYSLGTTYGLPTASPVGNYTVVSNSTSTTFSETAILANTQYYYYIFSYNSLCTPAPYYLNSSPLNDNVLTCTDQTSLLSGTPLPGGTSATINFNPILGATSYILQYSIAGAGTWITAPGPVASGYTLTGLDPGTSYDIRLRGPNANCGTNKKIAPGFSTPCASLPLTVTEGFENGTTIPSCWTKLNLLGTSNFSYGSASTAIGTSPNPAAATGSNRLLFPSYSNSGNQTRFYSPVIVTTGTSSVDVEYKWYFSSTGGPGSYLTEGVQVQWSTNGTAWTNAGTLIKRYGATDGWQVQSLTLPAGAGNQPVLYVGFLFTSNAGYDSYLDDIIIRATPPCNTAGTAVASVASVCGTSGSTTLSASGYAISGAGLMYQWQSSTSNTFGSGITDIPGANNPASYIATGISATTYYRLKVTCTAFPATPGYSNIVTVTVSNPLVVTTTINTRCGIGTTTLQATTNGAYTLNWYTAASGGTNIGTGTSFITPEISATTDFYVSASSGSSTATIGATYSGTNDNSINVGSHGIAITTSSANITIISAKIPFIGKGAFTIQLQTLAGALVSSVTTAEITGAGTTAVTVPIGLPIPTPGNYLLIVTAITGTIDELGYISTASYPYTGLGGAFSITSGYWYGNDASDNMYLFNLVVSNACESARTMVRATVTSPPAVAVTPTTATICSGTSITANVTAATVGNFSSYSWTPASGSVSGGTPVGASVILSPTSTTTYTVSGSTASNCVNKATIVITVNPASPLTTGAGICSGGAATISAISTCSNLTPIGNTINGSWNAATDPYATQPVIFLPNSPTCQFDASGNSMNYTKLDFQVTVTGTYTFTMPNTTAYDGMGYIVTGAFVPGTCPGAGTWIVGDDDSGPTTFEPLMTANLTAGITYTLITTCYYPGSSSVTNNYTWNVTAPAGGQIATGTSGTIQWYNAPSTGTLLGTGSPFNPIGTVTVPTNTSTGSYTLYAACSNNATCRTATPFVIGSSGQWIGGTSTDWSNAANWCGGIPSSTTDGTIITGTPYKPTLGTGTGAVRNLTVNTGTTLTVSNAIMQIYGSITAGASTINAGAGTIELAGTATQAISGSSFTNRTVKNLIASNNVNVSATGGDTLKISGALSFGSTGKTFNSNNNVTISSDINGTGRVADVTGNTISGNFVVERYIPAKRGWRLMTSPVVSAALTINQAWQQGVISANWTINPRPGYGTHVTGGTVRTTAQGYDQGPLNASIYGYSGTAWNYLPLTTGELVNSQQGYMLFVRGSRAINLPASTPYTQADVTILNPTGGLRTGLQPPVNAPAGGGWTVVGNPFASPINFNNVTKVGVVGGVNTIGGSGLNTNNAYYLWDPYLGGAFGVGAFVTFSWNGSTYDKNIDVGSGSSSITSTGVIPSSAAFMVNFSAGGSIAIKESDKTTDVLPLTNVFRPAYTMGKLRTTLNSFNPDNSRYAIDGNLVTFSDYSSTAVDNEDAIKPNNFGEDFAIVREEKNISIERRGWINTTDTLCFNMRRMKQKEYELDIAAENLQLSNNSSMFLEDIYLHQKTVLNSNDISHVHFSITADAASAAADRFRIIFVQIGNGPVPVTFSTIKAWQQSKDIAVQWKVENEMNITNYEVEKSLDGSNFTSMNTTAARGGSRTYNWLDVHAVEGDNFYRVRSRDNNGEIKYSEVVRVKIGKGKPFLAIYPNPLTEAGLVNISFTNMPGGKYTVKIINNLGQLILLNQLIHSEGSSSEPLQLKNLSKGTYQMEISAPDKSKTVLSFLY